MLKEIQGVPDKGTPQELWERAACVIVVPGLKKAAFVVGGEYGKGLMSCRRIAASDVVMKKHSQGARRH